MFSVNSTATTTDGIGRDATHLSAHQHKNCNLLELWRLQKFLDVSSSKRNSDKDYQQGQSI